MTALVVHAHPSAASLSRALRDAAIEGLEARGHEVIVHDLYADGFSPAMDAEERLAYDSDNPVVDPQVRTYADALKVVDTVVFVYPTWWWGLPAILKGWFDRVLVPGEALLLERNFGPPRPGLSNIKHVVGITTYGSNRLASRVMPDGGRRLIRRTMHFVGSPRLRTTWLPLYGVEATTAVEREAFIAKVRATTAGL